MQSTLIHLKFIFSAIIGIIVNLLGGWDIALQTLLTLTVLDFFTGLITGIANKNLSSQAALRGIVKKIGIYTLIAVVAVGGEALENTGLRTIIIGFFIITEIISIVENWADFGLPIPPQLKNILAELKK